MICSRILPGTEVNETGLKFSDKCPLPLTGEMFTFLLSPGRVPLSRENLNILSGLEKVQLNNPSV